MVIVAGIVIYRKAPRQIQRRSVAPKPISGLSNPLFYTRDSSLPAKNRPPDPSETVSTNQPPRPIVKPKRPPPAVSAILLQVRGAEVRETQALYPSTPECDPLGKVKASCAS